MKRLQELLGLSGVAGIFLLAAALAFSNFVIGPLEVRGARLQDRMARKAPAAAQPGAEKVAAVYEFLQRQEETTDWLAKLHGIGAATGVQLKSASYKTQKTDARIVRYEIVLPVAGSYAQIREFLKRSLAEIPVLSLDSLTVKRNEGSLQAEMKLTLHMVKS
jgi:Tfp pilus assembly protein PilO